MRRRRLPGTGPVRRVGQRFGFTLIEMIIVITLIALISSALVPVITRPYIAENQVEAMNEMDQLRAGIQAFIADMGGLPSPAPLTLLQSQGLNVLLSTSGTPPKATVGTCATGATRCDAGTVSGWNGPYLSPRTPGPLVDPWGNAYTLELSISDPSQWRIRSLGPDRTTGTVDDIVFPGDASGTPTYYQSQGKVVLDIWKTNGVLSWPVESGAAVGWNVQISGQAGNPTACQSLSPPYANLNGNLFTCPAVWFGVRHVRVTDAFNNPVIDQNVTVNSSITMARVYITKSGLSGAALGFDHPWPVAGVTYGNEVAVTWTSGMPTPPGSAPAGTFAWVAMPPDPSAGGPPAGPPPRYVNYGSAIAKVSGTLGEASGTPGECQISFYLDPGSGTATPVTPTTTTSTTPAAPVFAQTPDNTTLIPFTIASTFTLPQGVTNWVLYAVAEPTTTGGTYPCQGSVANGSASLTFLSPPRINP